MSKKYLIVASLACALLTLSPTRARAQHGDAGPDFQAPAPGYMGDTWTGQVTAVDTDKREITLTATTKKGTQTFVAYLPEHFVNGDEKNEVKMSDFAVGQDLRLFYIPKNPKINGKKVKRNEIIRIESVHASNKG